MDRELSPVLLSKFIVEVFVMTFGELWKLNCAWEDDSALKILDSVDQVKVSAPRKWLARSALSIYRDRKVRWFDGDFICLEDE